MTAVCMFYLSLIYGGQRLFSRLYIIISSMGGKCLACGRYRLRCGSRQRFCIRTVIELLLLMVGAKKIRVIFYILCAALPVQWCEGTIVPQPYINGHITAVVQTGGDYEGRRGDVDG